MPYYLGLDLGTGSLKTVLFDEEGTELAQASCDYPLYQPHNGWSEQDPTDWFDAAISTIRTVVDAAAVPAEEVAGIGLSGQMMGIVMLDRDGQPLRRAILWNDGRSTEAATHLRDNIGDELFFRVSATPVRPGLSAAKIQWVRENEPDTFARAAHILLPKDYLRYRLTGEFATEVSDASATQLLDVAARSWSSEMLSAMGLSSGQLGRVYESHEITGYLLPEVARATGLTEHCAVVGGASDNAAAALGVGITETGRAMTTIGTSGTVFAYSAQPIPDPNQSVYMFCMPIPGAWHYMGSVNSAGASLKWWRNTFYPDDLEYEAINADAISSSPGAQRLIYLPYLNGEQSPHFNLNCRGAFVGLAGIHTRADMTRAVMEGVSYALRDIVSGIAATGAPLNEMCLCGGGSKSSFWRQLLADIYGMEIVLPAGRSDAAGAFGVAMLAMVGCGAYTSMHEAAQRIVHMQEARYTPDLELHAYYDRVYEQFDALYPQLKDNFAGILALPQQSIAAPVQRDASATVETRSSQRYEKEWPSNMSDRKILNAARDERFGEDTI